MELRTLTLDHPDARRLITELQQEYVRRYGGGDVTPVDVGEFVAPRGTFVVGYLDGVAMACGGWRAPHRATPRSPIRGVPVRPAEPLLRQASPGGGAARPLTAR